MDARMNSSLYNADSREYVRYDVSISQVRILLPPDASFQPWWVLRPDKRRTYRKKKINREGRESIRPSAPFSRRIFLGSRAGRLGESTRVNSSRLRATWNAGYWFNAIFHQTSRWKMASTHRHVSRWRCVISIKKRLFRVEFNSSTCVFISYFACNRRVFGVRRTVGQSLLKKLIEDVEQNFFHDFREK